MGHHADCSSQLACQHVPRNFTMKLLQDLVFPCLPSAEMPVFLRFFKQRPPYFLCAESDQFHIGHRTFTGAEIPSGVGYLKHSKSTSLRVKRPTTAPISGIILSGSFMTMKSVCPSQPGQRTMWKSFPSRHIVRMCSQRCEWPQIIPSISGSFFRAIASWANVRRLPITNSR